MDWYVYIHRPKPESSPQMDDNRSVFSLVFMTSHARLEALKMMNEPAYDELNIERPKNYNDLTYKYEQLSFWVYRPFKCNEPGEVDDDTYLAYDTFLIKILKWLILERNHLLKSKAILNEQFLNSMLEHLMQKERFFVDKTSLRKPEPEEEP